MVKSVAVVLSGCGVYDGAEIQESVFALLALQKRGITFQCFAPDKEQHHVINHMTGEEMNETRNVMVEASRIVRGEISPLEKLDVNAFDGLLLPGGFGVAKNLSDFAFKGADLSVDKGVLECCKSFAAAKKPAAYACIAPALLPNIYGEGVNLTIGDDPETAGVLTSLGAVHHDRAVSGTVVDAANKVVTTPAYMLAENIEQAWLSLDALVEEFAKL